MRWMWIDKFTDFQSGSHATSVKNVTLAEEHLHDHDPGFAVMPGSLIIEGLAQTGRLSQQAMDRALRKLSAPARKS